MTGKLFVSVDVDEWYLARWASGSPYAIWNDLSSLFRDVYGQDTPIGEIEHPIQRILELFDELSFKSTFFITGLIASYYPALVRRIADAGHEIGCHNFYHIDYADTDRRTFRKDLLACKNLLEDLGGKSVIGYRSPNSSIPSFLVEELLAAGFRYDSSVTPTRRFMGKFGNFTKAPLHPYETSLYDIGMRGDSGLVEFPWSVFPVLKTPAGSGITHRIFGSVYNMVATSFSLFGGDTSYYFHPYEIDECAGYKRVDRGRIPVKARIFMRKVGPVYFRQLKQFLRHNQNKLINGEELLTMTLRHTAMRCSAA